MALLRNDAYERFKAGLFAERIQPGQFLSQKELCEVLDVPLGPMREALKRLEAEQLVELVPQRGVRIAMVDRKLVHDAFQIRRFLELEACRDYALNGDREALDSLKRATIEVLEQAERRQDDAFFDETMEVDWRLHNLLIDALDNRIVAEVHRVNSDKIRLIRLNLRFTAPRVRPAMEEHLAVIEALIARNADAAAAALDHHLRTAERRSLGLS
ncbi:MAG TPA: GntR family transcriptional regulator [Geminicoccaceae bacterium]|nr:GntR family transcriptional regulator [Geminicoccus sp.]HMU51431.1 GntR family transcriptional regulator [Geminicoccaceae bacterium]